jgi:hypothetical protein
MISPDQRIQTYSVRSGGAIVEVTVAIFVMFFVLAAYVQLSTAAMRQRTVVERRQIAIQELANVVETAMASPWSETTTEKLAATPLSSVAAAQLERSQLTIEVVDLQNPLPAKRIRVQLTLTDSTGSPLPPLQLIAWKYQSEESE